MTNTVPHPSPTGPTFWFIMSISLCAGFLVALPMNWWLVDKGLKHGMLTVRHEQPVPLAAGVALAGAALAGDSGYAADGGPVAAGHAGHRVATVEQPAPAAGGGEDRHSMEPGVGRRALAVMTVVSFLVFGAGIAVAAVFGHLTTG